MTTKPIQTDPQAGRNVRTVRVDAREQSPEFKKAWGSIVERVRASSQQRKRRSA